MLVTMVYISVKAAHVDGIMKASRINHETSIIEKWNYRFDVLQQQGEPGLFVLYEAWPDAAAAKAHKETDHYLTWRDTVADWMTKLRDCITYSGLYPLLADQA